MVLLKRKPERSPRKDKPLLMQLGGNQLFTQEAMHQFRRKFEKFEYFHAAVVVDLVDLRFETLCIQSLREREWQRSGDAERSGKAERSGEAERSREAERSGEKQRGGEVEREALKSPSVRRERERDKESDVGDGRRGFTGREAISPEKTESLRQRERDA
ncbi:hypothetical protein F2Q69_00031196 [Brassica cretica]|uniref:Uncharacterized protein n=1 Tax=Brassica cretica TaxID=69181 RepID=A0A8S9S1V5_BRACR|nr:hypothetical protein F2Q69_00031196 [Brassica cretica]